MDDLIKRLEKELGCYRDDPNKNVVVKIGELFELVEEVKRLTSEIEKVPEVSE